MSAFYDQLESMRANKNRVYFDFAGGLYPGKIVSLADDYAIVKLEHSSGIVMLHKHFSTLAFITAPD